MFVTQHRRPPEDLLIAQIAHEEKLEARRAAIRAATEACGPRPAAWWIANALGMTQEEIGDMAGCHARTVRRHIRRFREELRQAYRRPNG